MLAVLSTLLAAAALAGWRAGGLRDGERTAGPPGRSRSSSLLPRGIRPPDRRVDPLLPPPARAVPARRLGFGEIGMNHPVTPATMTAARSLIRYYYGLRIALRCHAGEYFWWYHDEDCLPYRSNPLWRALRAAFRAEAAAGPAPGGAHARPVSAAAARCR
ncbi:MAG: hypothetical protein ACLP52_31380 [Streptosporangiaceae bacterium]